MFYNLLEFPEALPPNRSLILQNIIDQYEPDIFMVCELQSEAGADEILNTSLNDEGNNYERAAYFENQSGYADLQQLIFFRKSKFTLLGNEIITTNVRDINHYTLQANTANKRSDPLLVELFVTHLKASSGGENEQKRLQMVQRFTNELEELNPNSFVVFSGDLNLYSSTEPAYQELLDPTNVITMVDPADTPGLWHNNSNFKQVHTQSTRLSSGPFGAGAGGGMDDRFDFILISENMQTNPKLKYVEGSYQAFGNNGNCFNNSVNSPDCTGDFSETLRNDLYNMSDHLPVVMELQTNKDIILSGTDFEGNALTISIENTLAKTLLKVLVKTQILENSMFSIYNVLGQKVLEHPINTSEKTIFIPVSHLADGIYYLQTGLQDKPLKFVKTS
ncbi:hypothetical protein [Marixanthomonas spongiae]|nr:hypothetical protein [Marixanthomonas spongiae]